MAKQTCMCTRELAFHGTQFFFSLFSLTLELANTWGGKVILQLHSPVSHVHTSLGWIVPPDNSDNTGRTHFPVSLT